MRTIAIGKNCFHVVVCDERGKAVELTRLLRSRLAEFIVQQPRSLIGWSRARDHNRSKRTHLSRADCGRSLIE
jgi:hypothetical protein